MIELHHMKWYHRLWFIPFAVIGLILAAIWGLTFGWIINVFN